MKKLLILILAVLLGWLVWDVYFNETPTPVGQYLRSYLNVHTVEYVVTEERYGQSLRRMADQLLAPLDMEAPNPISELSRLRAMATADARNELITPQERRLIQGLCEQLNELNESREHYETHLKNILERPHPTLHGPDGERKNKQFFTDQHLRRWNEFVQRRRTAIARDLTALRDAERQREHNQGRP